MLKLSCQLLNPWDNYTFKHVGSLHGSFTTYKHWEIESYLSTDVIFGFDLNTQWWGFDHAGITLEFTFCCITARFNCYDNRHWNYETKTWSNHNDNDDEEIINYNGC